MSHSLCEWMTDNAELFRYAGELSCMREGAGKILLSGTASLFLAPLFRTIYPESTIIASSDDEEARIIEFKPSTYRLRQNITHVVDAFRKMPEIVDEITLWGVLDSRIKQRYIKADGTHSFIKITKGNANYFQFFNIPHQGEMTESEDAVYVSERFMRQLEKDSISGTVFIQGTSYRIAGTYKALYGENEDDSRTIGSAFFPVKPFGTFYFKIAEGKDTDEVIGKMKDICREYVPETLPLDIKPITDRKQTLLGTVGLVGTLVNVLAFVSLLLVVLSIYSAISLDTAGLMAHTAEDIAWVLGEMVGYEPWDSTSENMPAEDFARDLNKGVKGMRLGVPRAWFTNELDGEVAAAVENVIEEYRRQGAEIVDIELPNAGLGVSVYYVVACAEASSNLSRFDGVRYGYRAKNYTDIQDMIKKSRNEGFGAEPKRRILIGTYVLSHGYYDAYYIKAQKVRRLIAQEFDAAFEKVDAIVSPVTTTTAYDFGSKSDPVSAYMSDLYTVPASLAGLPCMSMPCGMHSNGRPIGVQITCPRFAEARMLGVAHAWQQVTDWHKRHPHGF